MKTTEKYIGQHCVGTGTGAPGVERGQRGIVDRGVQVGQQSGGEQAMSVPACSPKALVSTERKY